MNGIICEKIRLPKNMNIHSHTHAQLLLPLHGSIYIETDADRQVIDESYLCFLPPECIHAYKGDIDNEFLVLNIPDHMVHQDDMARIQGGSRLQFDDRWKAIRHLIMSELNKNKCSNALNRLFYYFYQYIADHTASDSFRYINEHYTDIIMNGSKGKPAPHR